MQSKYRTETAIQTLCFELRWDVTVYLKKKKKPCDINPYMCTCKLSKLWKIYGQNAFEQISH